MKLTPTDFGGAMAVDSYGPGFFRVGRTVYHGPVLVTALREAGIAVEPMASPTAARSYNVTLSEGRRVACALLPL